MRLTAIAAIGENRVIGSEGQIPWHIPADFARFKRVTMGGVLIMGRKTVESIGRPLPGRITIGLSRTERGLPELPGGHWVASLDAALSLAKPLAQTRRIFIAGGAQIYRLAWPQLSDLDITHVAASPVGDARFPEIDPQSWRQTWREEHDGYTFATYEHAGSHSAP